MISGLYKIIARTLIERLKRVIDSLVNNHKMTFIKGRQILDSSLIVSECEDTRLKGEDPGINCKPDIEKAL